jgi:hypothetical protein
MEPGFNQLWFGLLLCIFVPDIIVWAPRTFFGPGVMG